MFDVLSEIFRPEPPREIIDVDYEDITDQIQLQAPVDDGED